MDQLVGESTGQHRHRPTPANTGTGQHRPAPASTGHGVDHFTPYFQPTYSNTPSLFFTTLPFLVIQSIYHRKSIARAIGLGRTMCHPAAACHLPEGRGGDGSAIAEGAVRVRGVRHEQTGRGRNQSRYCRLRPTAVPFLEDGVWWRRRRCRLSGGRRRGSYRTAEKEGVAGLSVLSAGKGSVSSTAHTDVVCSL